MKYYFIIENNIFMCTAFKITRNILNTFIFSDGYDMNFQNYGSLRDFSSVSIFLLALIYERS